MLKKNVLPNNDFVDSWMSQTTPASDESCEVDDYAKISLNKSYANCLTFPWLKKAIDENQLQVHRWFFDIKHAQIQSYDASQGVYTKLKEA